MLAKNSHLKAILEKNMFLSQYPHEEQYCKLLRRFSSSCFIKFSRALPYDILFIFISIWHRDCKTWSWSCIFPSIFLTCPTWSRCLSIFVGINRRWNTHAVSSVYALIVRIVRHLNFQIVSSLEVSYSKVWLQKKFVMYLL